MKLTAPQDVLAAVCGWVTATAGLGKTLPLSPALAGLMLTADADGTLTVAGFGYEVSASARMSTAEVGEPGQALIPARLLTQVITALPGQAVTLAADGTRVTITAGQVTYTLLLLPHQDYPALPEPGAPAAEFGADYLAAAVAQAVTAASHDDTLPALTCVHLTLDGTGTATLAATDRYRLAAISCPYTPHGDAAEAPCPVLIPARELAAVTKRPGAATITLALDGDATAAFTTADRHVNMRLTAAEFPAYATLIPAEADITATVTADLPGLAAAVKRAAVVAEKNTPVRLGFTPGAIHIEAGTGDEAALAEDIPAGLDGDPFPIAFNPGYLLDTLGAVAATGTGTVRLALTGPARPALITPAEPGRPVVSRHVLMPLRGTG